MTWHVLQIASPVDEEFASALGQFVPTLGWLPEMQSLGILRDQERRDRLADPPLDLCRFPLQRGYSRFPLSSLVRLGPRQEARLLRHTERPAESPLVCTTPYWAPVAERWPGPVVYYLTDLLFAYDRVKPSLVRTMDRRMCQRADVVCPNSRRIADYLMSQAACPASKIEVVPNATRAMNTFASCPSGPGELPEDLLGLPRPVAGVIGNLAGNMDWLLLRDAVRDTPDLSWAFVGPTTMAMEEPAQRRARQELMEHGGRVRFVGGKPYGRLRDYARAFDVAVLPYRFREPTFSGSSTRFYEHLAACRPMVATRGFEELLRKEPLLRLADTAPQVVAALRDLSACGFRDGHEEARWRASQEGTWECRAQAVMSALGQRWSGAREGQLALAAGEG